MTKLTLEDLEAMRRHYGIAQEEDLQGDLEQVGVLEEVGIGLERWAWLRGLPMDYALALGEYLDQEEGEEEANRGGPEQQAAELLGVSKGAVRMRVKRGTLRSEKGEDGRVQVWVNANPDDPNSVHPETQVDAWRELIDKLRDGGRSLGKRAGRTGASSPR